ncbi:hypothetical protein SAMN03159341_12064 [Paenibacillus sp. 1_12]|uniref:hypothetical protein n=1 Tax=Paenibacillus sp. 1_12 TaxID=1566278 RepID=UPI0008E8AF3A|nr:hypothetical protein [Paenibacillus sp. 1_12]SFM20653.1 hypothetical protein SAMN03159341_12064 [Paenibacillus sp. 1_12]
MRSHFFRMIKFISFSEAGQLDHFKKSYRFNTNVSLPNRILFRAVLLLLLLLGLSLSHEAMAADLESTGMKLPQALSLKDEATPVYDAINGVKLYEAAPQKVQVTGAENGWDQKLLSTHDEAWFQIHSIDGDRWVHVQSPEWDESDYQYIALTGSEHLYDQRFGGGRSLGTISPQVVRSIYSDQGYYRIQTWLGYKWIHPEHPVFDDVNAEGSNSSGWSAQLRTITPLFLTPDLGSEVVGWLQPQWVQSKITLYKEWYYIDTWEGKRWVHTNIGYPKDLQKENTRVTFKASVNVYEHPDKRSRVLGTLAPQTVEVFEHGSGWHHIHSNWLGDVWIYQVAPDMDPDLYSPPADIVAKVIPVDWMIVESAIGTRRSNYPFDLTAIVSNGEYIDPEATFTAEQRATIRFNVKNVSSDKLTMDASTTFEIEIVRLSESNDDKKPQLVWSGKLKAPKDLFNSGSSAGGTIDWDLKDANGKQVPFGLYSVQIKLPMTISYTENDTNTKQLQEANSAILTHFPLRIGAP